MINQRNKKFSENSENLTFEVKLTLSFSEFMIKDSINLKTRPSK